MNWSWHGIIRISIWIWLWFLMAFSFWWAWNFLINDIMNCVWHLCAPYDKNETICVHYVKWLLCESNQINDTSGPTMLVDKDLVVAIWHLGPCLIADKGLVITWSCRGMWFCDFNPIMCTWWLIYDELYEMNVCMICLMIYIRQDYVENGAMCEYIDPNS